MSTAGPEAEGADVTVLVNRSKLDAAFAFTMAALAGSKPAHDNSAHVVPWRPLPGTR